MNGRGAFTPHNCLLRKPFQSLSITHGSETLTI
jgi:hypothetical protein